MLNKLNKTPIFLANFLCFLESSCTFAFHTAEVVLDFANVGLKVTPNEVCILTGRIWITRNEGSGGAKQVSACAIDPRKINEIIRT